MRVKKLTADGFRSLNNFSITFADDISVIVGENDSGKTSLIDCLKTITQKKTIELDDFSYSKNEIQIEIEIDNFRFKKIYKKEGDVIQDIPLEMYLELDFSRDLLAKLTNQNINISLDENEELIRENAKLFGIVVRSNSNIENLRQGIIEKLQESINNPDFKIEGAQFPQFNNIFLDGKQFENVPSFFKEVFLKDKQKDIWEEKVGEDITLEDFICERIDNYSKEISQKIDELGIKNKLKIFISNLTEIIVEPIYKSSELNINAKVMFLENGEEINIEKKGDGTKRRITMALLDFKKDQSKLENDISTIYFLDEPDTHLHVKAQIELLSTLQDFAKNGNQVILTTHSPFIINSVKPSQIRLLVCKEQNCSKVVYLNKDTSDSNRVLIDLGVENVYLFFSRYIVVVEGETEKAFIENYFYTHRNQTLSSSLVKIINVEGIQNIYGFSRAIQELHNPKNTIVVFDNDASSELRELIGQLNIPEENRFLIGTKEFEDAFSNDALYLSWKKYCEENNCVCPKNWTVENISNKRKECILDETQKFSKSIRELNQGGKKMTKPILGFALGKFIEESQLPILINDLLQRF